MSTYFDMLGSAGASACQDAMTLAQTRAEDRNTVILAGLTIGALAVTCPLPFLIHAVLNLTAAGVRAAERESMLAEHAPGRGAGAGGSPA